MLKLTKLAIELGNGCLAAGTAHNPYLIFPDGRRIDVLTAGGLFNADESMVTFRAIVPFCINEELERPCMTVPESLGIAEIARVLTVAVLPAYKKRWDRYCADQAETARIVEEAKQSWLTTARDFGVYHTFEELRLPDDSLYGGRGYFRFRDGPNMTVSVTSGADAQLKLESSCQPQDVVSALEFLKTLNS